MKLNFRAFNNAIIIIIKHFNSKPYYTHIFFFRENAWIWWQFAKIFLNNFYLYFFAINHNYLLISFNLYTDTIFTQTLNFYLKEKKLSRIYYFDRNYIMRAASSIHAIGSTAILRICKVRFLIIAAHARLWARYWYPNKFLVILWYWS